MRRLKFWTTVCFLLLQLSFSVWAYAKPKEIKTLDSGLTQPAVSVNKVPSVTLAEPDKIPVPVWPPPAIVLSPLTSNSSNHTSSTAQVIVIQKPRQTLSSLRSLSGTDSPSFLRSLDVTATYLFRSVIGRDPDSDERRYLRDQIQDGKTLEELRLLFEAARHAINHLATSMNLSDAVKSRIQIISAQDQTWSNRCLVWQYGICSLVYDPVSGKEVVLKLYGNEFTYRLGELDPGKAAALFAVSDLVDKGYLLEAIRIGTIQVPEPCSSASGVFLASFSTADGTEWSYEVFTAGIARVLESRKGNQVTWYDTEGSKTTLLYDSVKRQNPIQIQVLFQNGRRLEADLTQVYWAVILEQPAPIELRGIELALKDILKRPDTKLSEDTQLILQDETRIEPTCTQVRGTHSCLSRIRLTLASREMFYSYEIEERYSTDVLRRKMSGSSVYQMIQYSQSEAELPQVLPVKEQIITGFLGQFGWSRKELAEYLYRGQITLSVDLAARKAMAKIDSSLEARINGLDPLEAAFLPFEMEYDLVIKTDPYKGTVTLQGIPPSSTVYVESARYETRNVRIKVEFETPPLIFDSSMFADLPQETMDWLGYLSRIDLVTMHDLQSVNLLKSVQYTFAAVPLEGTSAGKQSIPLTIHIFYPNDSQEGGVKSRHLTLIHFPQSSSASGGGSASYARPYLSTLTEKDLTEKILSQMNFEYELYSQVPQKVILKRQSCLARHSGESRNPEAWIPDLRFAPSGMTKSQFVASSSITPCPAGCSVHLVKMVRRDASNHLLSEITLVTEGKARVKPREGTEQNADFKTLEELLEQIIKIEHGKTSLWVEIEVSVPDPVSGEDVRRKLTFDLVLGRGDVWEDGKIMGSLFRGTFKQSNTHSHGYFVITLNGVGIWKPWGLFNAEGIVYHDTASEKSLFARKTSEIRPFMELVSNLLYAPHTIFEFINQEELKRLGPLHLGYAITKISKLIVGNFAGLPPSSLLRSEMIDAWATTLTEKAHFLSQLKPADDSADLYLPVEHFKGISLTAMHSKDVETAVSVLGLNPAQEACFRDFRVLVLGGFPSDSAYTDIYLQLSYFPLAMIYNGGVISYMKQTPQAAGIYREFSDQHYLIALNTAWACLEHELWHGLADFLQWKNLLPEKRWIRQELFAIGNPSDRISAYANSYYFENNAEFGMSIAWSTVYHIQDWVTRAVSSGRFIGLRTLLSLQEIMIYNSGGDRIPVYEPGDFYGPPKYFAPAATDAAYNITSLELESTRYHFTYTSDSLHIMTMTIENIQTGEKQVFKNQMGIDHEKTLHPAGAAVQSVRSELREIEKKVVIENAVQAVKLNQGRTLV